MLGFTNRDSHVATATNGKLGVGVLHDLDSLGDLIRGGRTENAFRVHQLIVGPELGGLVVVDIIATVVDGVRDMLAEGVAAIGVALSLDGGRGRGLE